MELAADTIGIDVHVHYTTGKRREQSGAGIGAASGAMKSGAAQVTAESMTAYYREHSLRAVIFDVDASRRTGMEISNDEIADVVDAAPDVFLGFCSVDPFGGRRSILELTRAAQDLGLRGVKFQPITQEFEPNDRRVYPLYEACAGLGLVATFHTGTTAIDQGKPGGGGLKLKYGRPIPYLDDVAADFPDLTVIAAHPGWPWENELLAVARHKDNVYIDLSGWAPKYFPESVLQQANTLLQDKCMFGSDYPMLLPGRWLDEFAALPIRDAVRPKILWQNAARVLGLHSGTAA